MTKLRPPLSFEQALREIRDAIGEAEVRAIIGRSMSRLTDYLDPDAEGYIRLDHAFALERRYCQLGHPGAPLQESWAGQLGLLAPAAPTIPQLLGQIAETVLEMGEATAASIAAACPNATPAARDHAIREIDEAIAELQRKRTMLTSAARPP
ncbi:hypothetical protein [Sphingomonas sp. IW22]|uniref:hypothetical protein n=1 Tax=Sphingomonas sp. IW22 TaxID=3242489 RepID=UPI00351FCC1C